MDTYHTTLSTEEVCPNDKCPRKYDKLTTVFALEDDHMQE